MTPGVQVFIVEVNMDNPQKNDNLNLRFGINYFFLFAIYGISSPYLQIMVRRLGYGPASVGVFLGLFELIGIAGPIYLAQKADLSGRFKPYLLASGLLVILGLALLIPFKVPFFTALSIGLLSLGLKTPIPVLDASLLKAIENQAARGKKSSNYGVLRAAGSIGFVLVTLLVQGIPGFDESSPGTMALWMGSMAIAYIAGLLFLPETGNRQRSTKKISFTFSWVDSTFLIGLGVIALGRLAMASIGSFFSLYLTEYLNWHAVGAMWALSATAEIPMIIFSWKFIKKWSPMLAINIASVATIVRLLIYAFFPTPAGAIVGQILHSLCYGLFQPAAVAFVSLKTPPAERTTGMAIFMGLGMGLPAFIGSVIGGFIVEALGYRWLFASFTVFALASLTLYFFHRKELAAVR